jgi:hypothetical protein
LQPDEKVDVVAQMQAPTADEGGAPPMLTVGGRYDLDFTKVATEWRIAKRNMTTRYTIGDPAALARARGQRHPVVTARQVNRHEREG